MGCEIKKCHVTIFNHILKENIKKNKKKHHVMNDYSEHSVSACILFFYKLSCQLVSAVCIQLSMMQSNQNKTF